MTEADRSVEWPTVALIVAVYGSWVALVATADALAWWVAAPLLAVLGAWHMSMQHEIIHGHPFRSRRLNTIVGYAPFAWWIPFETYRRTHLKHHRNQSLTDPVEDPESFYVSADTWVHLSGPTRAIHWVMRTLAGRLLIGPLVSWTAFLRNEWQLVRGGDRSERGVWFRHLPGVAVVVAIVVIAPISLPLYAIAYVYFGYSVSMIRSFAEHQAVTEGSRSAVVYSGPFFSLLFLNLNLHHAHHARPTAPWYELPALTRELGDHESEIGAGVYRHGYAEIFAKYFFRPFHTPVNPLGPVGIDS